MSLHLVFLCRHITPVPNPLSTHYLAACDPNDALPEVLAAFGQVLGKRNDNDTRAAIPPLVAMLHLVPGAAGAPADAGNALAQLMAESPINRALLFEIGGADALVKLLDSEATPKACNGASHALHMLVRSADLCKGVAEAGAVRVLCRMAAERGQMLDGAMPAAAALCNLAETSTNIRAQIRECNGCDALASLILVSGESGAATKFAGYALYSLMQEHRDFVVDAIETHCKNEPAWGRVLLLALHLTSPDVCTLCR